MMTPKPVILFVDDAIGIIEDFTQVLESEQCRVLSAARYDDALAHIDSAEQIDLAILDLHLPLEGTTRLPAMMKGHGGELGFSVAEHLRKTFPRTPILFWSGSADQTLRAKVLRLPNSYNFPKDVAPRVVLDFIRELLRDPERRRPPEVFIVHGHAENLLIELKNWLADELQISKPIVLRDMSTDGRTLIEKLEQYASTAELVFVLLTPDDSVLSSRQDVKSRRARQNVIFELGYFYGRLGRRTGAVILLSQGKVELPSDINGILTIDVSNGIAVATEQIRREIDRIPY
jgi:CheY-like chemotaxis protein